MSALARRAFDHRADLLAALVYLCLAYLSFNALADYANGHHLFPQPYGGWAFAVAVDGSVLYAFISFKRAPWMAGVLLLVGAATTYFLQRWHAQDADHPLIVAGVVPGLMVLVTLAWHLIRELGDDVSPVSQVSPPVPVARVGPPPGPPDQPVPGSQPQSRRTVATPAPSRQPGLTPAQYRRVEGWVAEGRTNKSQMARDLGLSDRAKKERLAPLVDELVARVGSPAGNGDGP
jgi:hypothetical protein